MRSKGGEGLEPVVETTGLKVRGIVRRREKPSGMKALIAALPDMAPVLAALAVSSGALFAGYNSLLGQALAYVVNASLFVILWFLYPPSRHFWRQAVPVLALCVCAGIWLWMVNGGKAVLSGYAAPIPYAPDLFGAEMLGFAAGVLALLGGALLGRHMDSLTPFLRWTVIFNLLWIVWGLVLRVADLDGAFDLWTVTRQGRFIGTIGNANVTAALAGAMAILSASRLQGKMDKGWRRRPLPLMGWLGAFLIFTGVMAATASRSAIGFMLCLLPLLLLTGTGRSQPLWERLRRVRLSRSAYGIGGILLIVLLVAGSILLDRLESLGGDFGLRQMMWGHYAALSAQSPLYGYGPGAFSSLNAHFLGDVPIAQELWSVNSSHNILLQLALNGGLPYCALLVAAFVLVSGKVVRSLKHDARRAEVLAAMLALAQILSCAMIDIALDVPAMVTLFVFLGGLLWGRAIRLSEPRG